MLHNKHISKIRDLPTRSEVKQTRSLGHRYCHCHRLVDHSPRSSQCLGCIVCPGEHTQNRKTEILFEKYVYRMSYAYHGRCSVFFFLPSLCSIFYVCLNYCETGIFHGTFLFRLSAGTLNTLKWDGCRSVGRSIGRDTVPLLPDSFPSKSKELCFRIQRRAIFGNELNPVRKECFYGILIKILKRNHQKQLLFFILKYRNGKWILSVCIQFNREHS